MSGIALLVYGPVALALVSVGLVRLLVRPKLKVPPNVYTGARARLVLTMPDGRKHVVGSFKAINYSPDNVYMLKDRSDRE
jgi:hypothetical protein